MRSFYLSLALLAALGVAALTPGEASAFGWRNRAYVDGYYSGYYYSPNYTYYGAYPYYTMSSYGGYGYTTPYVSSYYSSYYAPTYSTYPATSYYYSPGTSYYYSPGYDRSFSRWAPYGYRVYP